MSDKPEKFEITREALASGLQLAAIRANAPADVRVLTDEELDASLTAALDSHPPGEDLYLFAYGSLIWNPSFNFVGREKASIEGWSRQFCLWMYMGRGTPEKPGLMLGLDKGGNCDGVAFRLSASTARSELKLVWMREMFASAYVARWITARIGGQEVQALTFVVNTANPRYVTGLSDEHIARYIAAAKGSLGTCLEYFVRLRESLSELGQRDELVERLAVHLGQPA